MDVQKLKTLLKFDGIATDDFTDDELQLLIDIKTDELEGLTGIDIKPHDRVKTKGRFKGKMIQLSHYPILNISDITVNGFPLRPFDYNVNAELGIIYFKHKLRRVHVRVEYTTGMSEWDYSYYIAPLIKDMIGYTISYGRTNDAMNNLLPVASSLKEGDVSIGFKTGNSDDGYGYNLGIAGKINDLRNRFMYSTRLRWI